MTLKQIAQEAGVSVSTASRVINSKDLTAASPRIQKQILEIAERYNYVSTSTSRKLREQATTGGLATTSIACLHARSPKPLTDPFFSTLALSLENEASKHNCTVKYTFSAVDFENPSAVKTICSKEIDGVAIIGRCDSALLSLLKENVDNLIYIGLNSSDSQCDCVTCDGFQIGYSAVKHLIDLGHTHIAYVGELINERRYTGYCSALKDNQIPIYEQYASDVILTSEGGYQGARTLLQNSPSISAIFCANNITAIGVMQAVKEAGYQIPQDISVVGVDDFEVAQFLSPALTTVQIPLDELGCTGAKILIDRINGGHLLPSATSLPHKIIERESCAPAR